MASERIDKLLARVLSEGASDIHISEGRIPTLRVDGTLVELVDEGEITRERVGAYVDQLLTPENKELLAGNKQVDFGFTYDDAARFRGNIYYQRGSISIALRFIPLNIKNLADLNLPEQLEMFAKRQQGFFLMVGPTGHGKTTTLAALLDIINTTRLDHIITIEDPIEYIHTPKKSMIDQRQVRTDTPNFYTALRGVFRQDVDVIMVGEMRDAQTMSAAVTAAETGHLVYSTLHTNTAAQTVERIIDSFPSEQQNQIRLQLAASLAGIMAQRLLPRISGGLIPAYELLINNTAVANLIREGRTHEIDNVIETSYEQGMISMNRSLVDLVRRGEVSAEVAKNYSFDPQALDRML